LALAPLAGVSLDLEAGYRSMLTKTADDSGDIGFFDFNTRLGTRWQRTFSNAEGGYALRHDFEPEITYLHVADGGQETFRALIPENTFLPTDRVTLGLTNRLTTRKSDSAGNFIRRERLWLRLSSGYALNTDAIAPETLLPLRSELLLSTADWYTLRTDASYGLEAGERRWNSIVSGIQLKDSRRDELYIDYYFRDDDVANYLSGRLFTPVSDKIFLGYEARYSVAGREFLENRVDLEYRGQCWSIIFTYRDRLDDQQYLVNFALAGLMEQGIRPPSAPYAQ
jgi:LPS-assembly protein